jgi:uncharacterized protein YjbJ (UPF0337 family)
MNKDTVKGTIDELAGGAKRGFGKLTGNTGLQVEGGIQQLKGKAEGAIGKLKDAGRQAKANISAANEPDEPVVVHRDVVVSDDSILP